MFSLKKPLFLGYLARDNEVLWRKIRDVAGQYRNQVRGSSSLGIMGPLPRYDINENLQFLKFNEKVFFGNVMQTFGPH